MSKNVIFMIYLLFLAFFSYHLVGYLMYNTSLRLIPLSMSIDRAKQSPAWNNAYTNRSTTFQDDNGTLSTTTARPPSLNTMVMSKEANLKTYANVCVTGFAVEHSTNGAALSLEIKIHNSPKKARRRIRVSGSKRTQYNFWDPEWTPKEPPKYCIQTDAVAYFVPPTCPGNLYHFWDDEFRGLYASIKATGRLNRGHDNVIVYRQDSIYDRTLTRCANRGTFHKILTTLNTREFMPRMGECQCFRYGVFGLKRLPNPREAVQHVMNRLGVTRKHCPHKSERVVIVQRTYRRILNTDELERTVRSVGFTDVQVVMFEKLTIEEQLRLVVCTKLLIGLNGAALQWLMAMEPGSDVIEIAWPHLWWDFFFPDIVKEYGIKLIQIKERNIQPNWESYEFQVRHGHKVPPQQRAQLVKAAPITPHLDNIWKWADVNVTVSSMKEVLAKLYRKIHK